MNDGNIKYYLETKMEELTEDIKRHEVYIKSSEECIDDNLKTIANLKVHYTSLLNTAIAYGHEVEEDEQDNTG